MFLKTILSGLALLLTLSLSAQSNHPDLDRRLSEYGHHLSAMRFDSVLDYIDPLLYDLAPREVILKTFQGLTLDSNMAVTFGAVTFYPSGRLVEVDGDQYTVVTYAGDFYMKMLSEDYRDPAFLKTMTASFERMYGKHEVTYDTTTHTFTIRLKKQLVATRRGGDAGAKKSKKSQWNFIEFKPEMAALFDPIIPEPVRRQLKLQ